MSLEALQRAALGQSQGKVVDWLKSRGLERSPRLAQQLSVDAGWERAVETVLGGYLEAVCVDSLDDVAGMLESLTAGTVTFFAGAQGAGRQRARRGHAARARAGPGRPRRAARGHRRDRHAGRGAGACGRALRAGQSVITRDGIWIGPDWLRVSRDTRRPRGRDRARAATCAAQRQRARRGSRRGTAARRRARGRCAAACARPRTSSPSRQAAVAQRRRAHEPALAARRPARPRRAAQRSACSSSPRSSPRSRARSRRPTPATLPRAARLEEAVGRMADLEEQRVALEAEREQLRAAR